MNTKTWLQSYRFQLTVGAIFISILLIPWQLQAQKDTPPQSSIIKSYAAKIDSIFSLNIDSDLKKNIFDETIHGFYGEFDKIYADSSSFWLDSIYDWSISNYRGQRDLVIDLLQPLNQADYVFEIDSQNEKAGRTINLLAILLRSRVEPQQVLELYIKANSYFQKCEFIEPHFIPGMYNNIGNIFKDLGDLSKALEYSSEGVRIANLNLRKMYLTDVQKEKITTALVPNLMNLGLINAKMLKHTEAVHNFETALELAYSIESSSIHRLLNNLGISLTRLGRYDEAEIAFNEAVKIASEIDAEAFQIQYLVNLSDLLRKYKLNSFVENLPSLRKIIFNLTDKNLKRTHLSLTWVHESLYNEKLGNYSEALSNLNTAYQILNGLPVQEDLATLTRTNLNGLYPYPNLDIILNQAKITQKQGIATNETRLLIKALDQFAVAESIIDSLRGALTTQESKIILNQKQKWTFGAKADLCGTLFTLTGNQKYLYELFNTCEKGKSAGLWSEIQQSKIKAKNIDEDLLAKEIDLKKKINKINDRIATIKMIDGESDEDEINSLKDRKIILTSSLDSLIQVYNRKFPHYYKLKFANTISGIKDVQANINQEESFIQYYFTDSTLHQIIVLKDTAIYHPLSNPDEILSLVEDVMIENKKVRLDYTREEIKQYIKSAYAIYQNIFEPINHLIKGKKLLISPDSKLALLPFESLVISDEFKMDTDFRDLDYLIYYNEVSYTYTATLWAEMKSKKTLENKAGIVLAFAPHYGGENRRELEQLFGQDLPSLPGTLEEIDHINKLFKAKTYTNEKATEARFKSEFENAMILHLAMHTISNDDDPLQTSLIFNLPKEESQDGRLSAAELLNYQLNSSLAVLSACNTGTGKIREGEGIMGLARSFIQAGCKSLILNLWVMDDNSGQMLINNFYSGLSKGESTSNALHNAKLSHLRSAKKLNSHPHYWSGLILMGMDSEIPIKPKGAAKWPLYLALGLLTLVYIFRRKKTKAPVTRDL